MIAIIVLFFSFISNSHADKVTPINYFQNKCEIRDQNDSVQFNYAGENCLFLEDGGLIVYKSSDGSTARLNSNGKVLWKRKLGQVLSINLDKSKKNILLLGQQVEKTFLCKALSKFLVRVDLNSGKTLSLLSGTNLIKEIVNVRSESKKYFPLLSPVNLPVESNPAYDCVLTGALDIKSIQRSSGEDKDKMLYEGDIFLYVSHELVTAYILSSDLQKIVWFFELDNPQEEIFKYHINDNSIYILSFEDQKKSKINIRKVSMLDKKIEWQKKIEFDSQAQFSLKSAKTNEIGISFQTHKQDGSFQALYLIDYSGNITKSNTVTNKIDDSQFKTLSDFMKNKK